MWFRELPQPILTLVPEGRLEVASTEGECVDLMRTLPRAELDVLDWMLQLFAEVGAGRGRRAHTQALTVGRAGGGEQGEEQNVCAELR